MSAPPEGPLPAPVLLAGPVVKGFGRGSKELGVPTANLDVDALGAPAEALAAGIYYGWARVGAAPEAHMMVMSIGWNPFYKNTKKTVEPHLLSVFPTDFYGEELRLVVCGYLRPEANFPSLEALMAAIHGDIDETRRRLAGGEAATTALAAHPFLHA